MAQHKNSKTKLSLKQLVAKTEVVSRQSLSGLWKTHQG